MNYVSCKYIPRDIWYIIGKFLSYDAFRELGMIRGSYFLQNNLSYKEYYEEEILGRISTKHMNYIDAIDTVLRGYQYNRSVFDKLFFVCRDDYMALLRKMTITPDMLVYIRHVVKYVAIHGDMEMLEYLLKLDPNCYKDDRYVILKMAVLNKQWHVLRYLIEMDSECIKAGEVPYDALRVAAELGYMEIVKYYAERDLLGLKFALIKAAEKGHIEIVKYLMNIDSNFLRDGNYAAMINAACYGQLPIVKYLVEIDPRGISTDDYRGLRHAASSGHLDIVKYLVEKDIGGIYADYQGALRWAVLNDKDDVVEYLIQKGCDPQTIVAKKKARYARYFPITDR